MGGVICAPSPKHGIVPKALLLNMYKDIYRLEKKVPKSIILLIYFQKYLNIFFKKFLFKYQPLIFFVSVRSSKKERSLIEIKTFLPTLIKGKAHTHTHIHTHIHTHTHTSRHCFWGAWSNLVNRRDYGGINQSFFCSKFLITQKTIFKLYSETSR